MAATLETHPTILLVDDNPHDVVLLRLAFRRVGIIDPIILVNDGIEAVRYLKGEGIYADRQVYPTPTLILLDLKMPQKSGFEVLQWIREQPALKGLLVVVLTGSKESDDVKRAYQLGANSYLVKPTKFSDLVKITESFRNYCSGLPAVQTTFRPPAVSVTGASPSEAVESPKPNTPGQVSEAL